MSTKMDDMSEKHDWRRVAVALASVVRPLDHEDELRRGWDAAAEKARLAEADAETELRRAEQYAGKCARHMEEIDALTVRLEAAEAARPEAVPVAGPNVVEVPRASTTLRSQIDALHADLNALREKQLDTQARCDKAIQARIEAQRERDAATDEREAVAAQLADARAGLTEHADQIKTLHADLERAEAARDQAIKERDKSRASLLHNVSEIESLRGKNKQLSDDVERLRDLREDANRARNEARAGLERVQAANAKLAAELEAERAKAGGQ